MHVRDRITAAEKDDGRARALLAPELGERVGGVGRAFARELARIQLEGGLGGQGEAEHLGALRAGGDGPARALPRLARGQEDDLLEAQRFTHLGGKAQVLSLIHI